jgi:DNA topoisomerase-1
MSKRLVIVESPTKAKTLKRFLGDDYVIESSVGHVRDLPAKAAQIPAAYKGEAWSRLGVNVEQDFEPLYIVQPEKKQQITRLKKLLKDGSITELLLATDEDREGEAISWHLVEVLAPKVPIRRMVFHEITKQAILESVQHTREIDRDLVEAQETRRIIDRLYGYSVSPVLWRKIGPRLSAGRVQSVAIRMLVEREEARMRFRAAQYWDLVATVETDKGAPFPARLHSLDGKSIAAGRDFDPDTGKLKKEGVALLDEEQARALRDGLREAPLAVVHAEEKPVSKRPSPPFTTSTLQQEGNRKLRFDAKRTMRAAQRLYENGFITYMRTDSVALSDEAVRLTREAISDAYGDEYLPDAPRRYKTKVANAQEAHEAIRPAGERVATVEEVSRSVGSDEARIYELIWKRTLACQMRDSKERRMTVRVQGDTNGHAAVFQATGNVIDFPGFRRAYVEGSDDPESALADQETTLPPLVVGDKVSGRDIEAEEHVTSPPARFTEATLVKALEESGIGRPSTYASIIDTIQRREYTFKKGSALVPTFTAFAVVRLMREFLTDLIDKDFTARMENRLDEISRGERERLAYLREFYEGNGGLGLKPMLEGLTEDIDPRTVCSLPIGEDEAGRPVIIRVGRYGPFLQRGDDTAPVPDQTCPDEITVVMATELLDRAARADEPIGAQPETGLPIYLKTGRYGPYIQVGDTDGEEKPKMVSLLANMSPEELDLETAIKLASLPRTLGADDNGVEITAHNGRYGPYIKRGDDTRSLGPDDNLLEVGLTRALELLAQEKKGRGFRRQAKALKVFEKVEALEGIEVKLLEGRYGPYLTDGEVNASLPKGAGDPMEITEEQVVELILKKREAKPRRKKKAAKKKAAKKKAAKKKAAKKKAAKKKASKKAAKKKSSKKAAAKKVAGDETPAD